MRCSFANTLPAGACETLRRNDRLSQTPGLAKDYVRELEGTLHQVCLMP